MHKSAIGAPIRVNRVPGPPCEGFDDASVEGAYDAVSIDVQLVPVQREYAGPLDTRSRLRR
jgi:hypothetical protein